MTIFLTSHVLEVVERLVTHVGIIREGRLAAQGTLEEVRGAGSLEEVFIRTIGEEPGGPAALLAGGRPVKLLERLPDGPLGAFLELRMRLGLRRLPRARRRAGAGGQGPRATSWWRRPPSLMGGLVGFGTYQAAQAGHGHAGLDPAHRHPLRHLAGLDRGGALGAGAGGARPAPASSTTRCRPARVFALRRGRLGGRRPLRHLLVRPARRRLGRRGGGAARRLAPAAGRDAAALRRGHRRQRLPGPGAPGAPAAAPLGQDGGGGAPLRRAPLRLVLGWPACRKGDRAGAGAARAGPLGPLAPLAAGAGRGRRLTSLFEGRPRGRSCCRRPGSWPARSPRAGSPSGSTWPAPGPAVP